MTQLDAPDPLIELTRQRDRVIRRLDILRDQIERGERPAGANATDDSLVIDLTYRDGKARAWVEHNDSWLLASLFIRLSEQLVDVTEMSQNALLVIFTLPTSP